MTSNLRGSTSMSTGFFLRFYAELNTDGFMGPITWVNLQEKPGTRNNQFKMDLW